MKSLLLLVVLVAVAAMSWFGFTRLIPKETPAVPAVTAVPAPKPAIATPQPAPPAPAPVVSAPAESSRVVVPAMTTTFTSASPVTTEKIDLALSLDANGRYHDDLRGVSANVPEGWMIRDAQRWGEGNRQNTVWMTPNPPTSVSPSMYYQAYPDNRPDMSSPETYLRGVAESKENSRNQGGRSDYKNVPDSFEFTQINGNPAMTYFATFSRGDEVMVEHFVRVLGQNGYVMFFTTGKLDDVKTILPHLKAMAASVKVP